jgi:hypothetical protein
LISDLGEGVFQISKSFEREALRWARGAGPTCGSRGNPTWKGQLDRLIFVRRHKRIWDKSHFALCLVPENFIKFFKISHHIESLDTCIKH